jgi:DNA-binding NarL/FixJ family response regulator
VGLPPAKRNVALVRNMDTRAKCTLLIADEFALVRDGIAGLCERSGQFTVVDTCSDGMRALERIVQLVPDVALIDYQIPRLFSLELVRQIRESRLRTRVMILSNRGDRKMAVECLRSGANGLLLKSADGAELFDALGRVMSGSVYVSTALEMEKALVFPRAGNGLDRVESLSSREYQVFQMLVDGVRAKEIANRLNLSPKTVDTYRASLMRKLDIHDVAGLVKFAIQRDMTAP